ncbi:LEA type 2 family protein [Stutzerimonas azotifigens]|uniref:LEA type 2 family protein n=1 Tax=Stutzerimonas azotifigens TaxID=291995 RepID=UPI0003F6BCDD|nr:LEA type 2 family protein [Stutzerimonas azotifigens]
MPRIPLPRLVFILLASLLLSSCALFANRDPLNVQVAGIEPLPGEGLELRLALKLRVQNPNTSAVAYDGLALSLEVNGRELASGVSDQRGEVPRFGERLITVPMTLSAFAVARQVLGLADPTPLERVPYVLRGKLAGGAFGVHRFVEKGTLELGDFGPYRSDIYRP